MNNKQDSLGNIPCLHLKDDSHLLPFKEIKVFALYEKESQTS